MTLKQVFLSGATAIVVSIFGLLLYQSFTEPQIQGDLELYQTNLVLEATAQLTPLPDRSPDPPGVTLEPVPPQPEPSTPAASTGETTGETSTAPDATEIAPPIAPPIASPTDAAALADLVEQLRSQLLGNEVFESALKTYETSRDAARSRAIAPSAEAAAVNAEAPAPARTGESLWLRVARDELRLGLLQQQLGAVAVARQRWEAAQTSADRAVTEGSPAAPALALTQTADLLLALWPATADPVTVPSDAAAIATDHLRGWFRDRTLARIASLQGRPADLAALQLAAEARSQRLLLTLGFANVLPAIGALVGTAGVIALIAQRFLKGKAALLYLGEASPWTVPWNGEVVWQVLVVGFFLAGQLVVPWVVALVLGLVGVSAQSFTGTAQAGFILANYVLLASCGLAVLAWSIRSHWPLDAPWFRWGGSGRWLLWGLGGYFVALPLVIGISLINQQIWDGQGGSNPILSIVVGTDRPWALLLLFGTAAIAAPLFEEVMFRGFLLPSLGRYFPAWGAIGLSSLIFSLAHLSLSEVLPLTVLGMVLGVVYWRSQSLLAPILLHGLWNGGTLISLVVLSQGAY